MALQQFRCKNHPGRHGIGRCPTCQATICEECSTRVDGILHCRDCLSKHLEDSPKKVWRSASTVVPALVLTPIAFLCVTLSLYLLAIVLALKSKLPEYIDKLVN